MSDQNNAIWKNTYSSIAIGTSTTIIISNARIVRVSKLRVAITLGYVCESAKGVTEVGETTSLPCRSISVWEGRQVNSSSRSVAYTIRFPCRRYAWFLSKWELHQKNEEEDKASRHSAIDSVIIHGLGWPACCNGAQLLLLVYQIYLLSSYPYHSQRLRCVLQCIINGLRQEGFIKGKHIRNIPKLICINFVQVSLLSQTIIIL